MEIAKRWVDAFNGRGVESLAALATPDFEWLTLAARAYEGGSFLGREGIEAYFEDQRTAWEWVSVVADEFRDLGDRVLVLGRTEGRGRASGARPAAASAVGKVQAFVAYECVSESCKALDGTGIKVTPENCRGRLQASETEAGGFKIRTGNRIKAPGTVFERINCVGKIDAQFFGEDAPRFLNNGLAIGSLPGEEEFDQPGSGELESVTFGGLKLAGKLRVTGYASQELIELKNP